MLSMQKEKGKLTNVNPRAELHGKDTVLAVDIKVEHKLSNDILSEFHPTLKAFLYEKGDDAQGELLQDGNHLTKRKFPLIPSIKYGLKLSGYEVVVDFGIDDKSAIEMAGCEIDNFKFEPHEGGTVALSYRVIGHPKEIDIGKLCSLIQQEISISLIEPPQTEISTCAPTLLVGE